MDGLITQLKDGRWVPAIPLPFYEHFWLKCHCGRRFLRQSKYEDHYRECHQRPSSK